jgi:hypothetical protein
MRKASHTPTLELHVPFVDGDDLVFVETGEGNLIHH